MDCEKMGVLIKTLRAERGMTQRELADALAVSDKAVSKWERGAGFPDLSAAEALSDIFGVSLERLFNGDDFCKNERRGSMKNVKFYVCPVCGAITMSEKETEILCCGRRLTALEPQNPDEKHDVSVETVEDEWYITSSHPMEKEHYISFAAFVSGERTELVRTYAEWELQVRFFKRGHGKLYWFCVKHGLYTKNI